MYWSLVVGLVSRRIQVETVMAVVIALREAEGWIWR